MVTICDSNDIKLDYFGMTARDLIQIFSMLELTSSSILSTSFCEKNLSQVDDFLTFDVLVFDF